MNKRTKIVATISDKRCEVDFIESLFKAGMNAVRINSAHVTKQSAAVIVENTRKVSEQIAIMIDTKGPEIRITGMEDDCADGIKVKAGDRFLVKGTDCDLKSSREMIYMNDPHIADCVPVGTSVLIDDGELELLVVSKSEETLLCEVQNLGAIKARKSVNIPGVVIDLPSVSEKDKDFINWAIDMDLDFIAHSFVRTKQDVLEVKKIINERKSKIKIISKIENREGVNNIEEILEETYGVMVARGDLGVEIPAEQIPVTQRELVRKCIQTKAPVIIATQMLHTMINNPRPTRAEISDVANAIYQRVDAVMLSGETASGDYPVEAVKTMAKVALEIEKDNNFNGPFLDMNMVRINREITAQLARSAVRATINLPIKAIVIDSLTGRTGRYIAAFRGQKPVYAVCYRKNSMRRLALSYGVYAIYKEPQGSHTSFLMDICAHLEDLQWVDKEDMVVVLGGRFGSYEGASFMEIGTLQNLQYQHENL
ncbi:MAG: pyruvate kinase [Rikenellaceae bacterium]